MPFAPYRRSRRQSRSVRRNRDRSPARCATGSGARQCRIVRTNPGSRGTPGALEHRFLQCNGAVSGASIHLAQQGFAHPVAELRDIAAKPRIPEALRQDQPDRLGAGEIILGTQPRRLDGRAELGKGGERPLASLPHLARQHRVAEQWPPRDPQPFQITFRPRGAPPQVRGKANGLAVRPKKGASVKHLWPNSGVVVLPTRIAPAVFSRATAGESAAGTLSASAKEPKIARTPLVLTRSLTANGTPCSGPNFSPRMTAASASLAAARASS